MKRVLYIGIPFCPTKCLYCNFYFPYKFTESYIPSLIREFHNRFWTSKLKVDAILIWWWTPNLLSHHSFDQLLKFIQKQFFWYRQLSVETHPKFLDVETVNLFHNHWVNRVSLGIQSFDKATLVANNREYVDPSQLTYVLELLKTFRISINFDFIYWLYWYTLQSMEQDLHQISRFMPDSVYFYPFEFRKNSSYRLNKLIVKDRLFYLKYAKEYFGNMWYQHIRPYVFVRKWQSYPCLYEDLLWNSDADLIWLWLAAKSFIWSCTYLNTSKLEDYLDDKFLLEQGTFKKYDYIKFRFLLRILVSNYINITEFNTIFDTDITQTLQSELSKLLNMKFMRKDDSLLCLTDLWSINRDTIDEIFLNGTSI